MLSFHPDVFEDDKPQKYNKGFEVNESNDLDKIAETIKKYVYGAPIWKDGHRKKSNFLVAYWAVLDSDEGKTIEEWRDQLCDMQHIIGTTKSHMKPKGSQPPCHRLRILIPFEQPIESRFVFESVMDNLIYENGCDKACKDAARMYFPCSEIVAINKNGFRQSIDIDVKELEPRQAVYKSLGHVPMWTQRALREPFPTGLKNQYCYQVAKDLYREAYTEDEIMELIVGGPYGGTISSKDREDALAAVRSGIKSVTEDGMAPDFSKRYA